MPFDDDFVPEIAQPGAVEALNEMINITPCMHPETGTAGLFRNWELFESGQTYCNIGWGGSQKYFNRDTSQVKNKLLHGLLPGGVVPSMSYFNWGWSYVVPSQSRFPEAAGLFAAFAASPGISTGAVRESGGYFDPFHASHYEDPQIVGTYSPEFLEVHKNAMKNPLPDLYLPGALLHKSGCEGSFPFPGRT